MKTLNTMLTYRVPSGILCHLESDSKKLCRFCIKHKSVYICVLHNTPLQFDGNVLKSEPCRKAVCGFDTRIDSDINDVPIQVNRKELMKWTIDQYRKAYLKLIKQDYCDILAHKFAKESVLKGDPTND